VDQSEGLTSHRSWLSQELSVSRLIPRSSAICAIVAPGRDRYNATASAFNWGGVVLHHHRVPGLPSNRTSRSESQVSKIRRQVQGDRSEERRRASHDLEPYRSLDSVCAARSLAIVIKGGLLQGRVGMTIDPDALAKELRYLRKDRGALHPDLSKRLGPEIKKLCEISEEDGVGAIRSKLSGTVQALLPGAMEHTTFVALTALGLTLEADQRFLGQRVAWLAQQLHCDVRTARRRIDEAFDRLVDLATRPDPNNSTDRGQCTVRPHYLKSLRAFLRLDTPSPELVEHRTVTFTQDGVGEIVSRFSLPRPVLEARASPELHVEVLYGGRLRRLDRLSDMDYQLAVELPRALKADDIHDYALLFRLPPGQPMRPHYIIHPLTYCELVHVVIKFAPEALPRTVWRLDRAPLRMVDDDHLAAEEIAVDRFGEVTLRFYDLARGLSYGAKWTT